MKISSAGWLLIIILVLTGGAIVFSTAFSLSNTREIQSVWKSFEASRSVKARSLSALRSQLGYGGMIHNFKNYILRRSHIYFYSAAQSLGGAKAELARYETLRLNDLEHQAIGDINEVLDAYGRALTTVAGLIRAGKTPAEIDKVVKIDDGPAIKGLMTLDAIEAAEDASRGIETNKACVVSTLRSIIGYGGMIHNYKNYLLRQDPALKDAVERDISRARRALEQYEGFGVNGLEKSAISRIRSVLAAYEKQSLNISRLIQQGKDPIVIDKAVYVEDEPALTALVDLDQEIVAQSEEGVQRLRGALARVITTESISLYVAVIATLLLIAACFWLIRVQIAKPIGRLTSNMMRLAGEDLDVEIHGVDKKNEIGDMARALKVFKDNVVLLQKAKQALHESNVHLERRVAERTQDLAYSEARLGAILETAADAIVSVDSEGIIRSFNAAAMRLFGLSRGEAVGEHVSMLVPAHCKRQYGEGLLQYLLDGASDTVGETRELVALRKNGDTFPIELTVSRIEDHGGALYTGIIRDVSEKKVAEQRLRQSKIAADRANRAKSEFLASMSHELRTPLNAILGFAQILKDDEKQPLNTSQMEAVQHILKGGDHLLELVDQILDLNRIERGTLTVIHEPVDLKKIIKECEALLKRRAAEKGVLLIDRISGSRIPEIYTDTARLKQVIYNLISNAIKYNRKGGEVILEGDKTVDGMFRLTITDTGLGIPSSMQDEVFKPFDRLGWEGSQVEGAGIGLAISRRIMALLRGDIGFESEAGKGSRFWVDVPVADGKARSDPTGSPGTATQNPQLPETGGIAHTVLYVEDNPANRRLMQVIIGQLEQVHLLTAQNAVEGIELAQRHMPQLILMDINLPDMPGTSALRILRNSPETAHIPVVAVSADAMQADIKSGIDAGFLAYLTKPLNVASTLQLIEKALEGALIRGEGSVLEV